MRDKAKVEELLAALKAQMTTKYELSVVEECEILLSEEWRDIDGYEGIYQVSDLGRIKSFHRGYAKILKPIPDNHGYFTVILRKNKQSKTITVHRLVAQTFIPNPDNKPEINHKSGIKTDNKVSNLEWVTRSENRNHAYKMGLAKSGVEHYESRLTVEQVRYIRKVYKRGDKNFSLSALARKFNMSKNAIHNVVKGKTYKNVD